MNKFEETRHPFKGNINTNSGSEIDQPIDSNLQKIEVWGSNRSGQLGLGRTKEHDISRPVILPFYRPVVKIAMGGSHTAIITNQMQLYVMGDN
jgi:alpha-tubulin suppressor-like RCC1 family protein